MAATPPNSALGAFALLAGLVAWLSASQDVVVDAYRTDLLPAAERGFGSSLTVLGYRLAMILSGGIAFIWVDPRQGGGWTWPEVYRAMALFMVGAAVFSALLAPRLVGAPKPSSVARNDVLGFLAVAAAVGAGFVATRYGFAPWARALVAPLLAAQGIAASLAERWADLVALFAGIAVTLPLVAWAARKARFETFLGSLASYFSQAGALPFLAFIVLYKLGDAFAGSLLTPFLLQAMHYSTAEVGVVNKVIGLWLTIAGALVGGALMIRLGLWRALMLFGILQMLGNLGFWWLALHGRDALPGLVAAGLRLGLRQARRADAGRRRPADGDRQREHHQRHGNGGLRRVPDEPVQPALQRDPVRAPQRVRLDRPGLGRAARRRAGAVDRLAGVLPRLDRRGAAGIGPARRCCAGRSSCSSTIRTPPTAGSRRHRP